MMKKSASHRRSPTTPSNAKSSTRLLASRPSPSLLSNPTHLEALKSLGVDNRQAVVIDVGAVLTKIGYSGEFLPRAIVRTELYNDEGENIEVFDNTLSADDFYFRLVDFFQNLFYKYALTVVKDRRVVIVESVLAPTARRNAIARVLFEALDAPSVLFAPSHLLATFPFGVSDALVIDVGYTEASVMPLLDGVTMLNQMEASSIGARRLEDRAYELLRKYGRVMTVCGEERLLTDEDDIILRKERVLEDIVVRFCFVTKMERGEKIQASGYDLEGDVPKPPCGLHLPLGENKLIVPGIVREWTAEIIFEWNDDIKSLPQMILDSVLRCPIDSRRQLLNSLILVGGPTSMKGFYARLRDETLRLLTSPKYEGKFGNINSVKFYRLPKTSIELYASWMGGSMFGSLEVLEYRSFSREEWLDKRSVPDWTTNVSQINGGSDNCR